MIQNRFGSLWDSLFPYDFDDVVGSVRPLHRAHVPAFNILEDEEAYTIQIAAPGLTKGDVEVKLDEEDMLVISAQREEDKQSEPVATDREASESKEIQKTETKPTRYLRREFVRQSFVQRVSLPDDVDKEHISAKMEHGVLEVSIPKIKVEEKAPIERMISVE